jgi:hypothetical protein
MNQIKEYLYMPSVLDGVIIGGAGGAIAGITVYLVQFLHEQYLDWKQSKTIHSWLQGNTSDEQGNRYRSTRAIASWCNLTEDRVRYLCSHHKNIYLSTGEKEDMWSIYIRSSEDRIDEGPGMDVF